MSFDSRVYHTNPLAIRVIKKYCKKEGMHSRKRCEFAKWQNGRDGIRTRDPRKEIGLEPIAFDQLRYTPRTGAVTRHHHVQSPLLVELEHPIKTMTLFKAVPIVDTIISLVSTHTTSVYCGHDAENR